LKTNDQINTSIIKFEYLIVQDHTVKKKITAIRNLDFAKILLKIFQYKTNF